MRVRRDPSPSSQRRSLKTLLLTLVLAFGLSSGLAVPATPFAAVVQGLLERFYSVPVTCPATEPDWHTCFRVQPANVGLLAEEVERLVDLSEKGILRSEWLYGNGVYQVYLHMDDTSWGYLELWLVELPGNRVEGRIAHVSRRRW